MSAVVELLSMKSPKLTLLNTTCSTPPMALRASSSLRFHSLLTSHNCGVSIACRRVFTPTGLGADFRSLDRRCSFKRSLVAFAASHEDSKHSEIEVKNEKDHIHLGAEESQEAWKQALASFKEQALKIQSLSQEAYQVQSKKAIEILKDTTEQLKIQAEKTRNDLGVIAKEISEEGKEYISTVAVQSPEPVKEVLETFSSSTDDLNHISEYRDFHIGIPYGLLLSLGGFLSFMLTGSVSAIRFGVILGGALLALSVSSLRSYKKEKPFPLALKGQTAISAIIFLREIRLLCERSTFGNFLTTFVSGVVVAFYVYRITVDGKKRRGSDLEPRTEN